MTTFCFVLPLAGMVVGTFDIFSAGLYVD